MTHSEAIKLPNGTRVVWCEGGPLDGLGGVINQDKTRVEWADGQRTLLTDKLICHVHLLPVAKLAE